MANSLTAEKCLSSGDPSHVKTFSSSFQQTQFQSINSYKMMAVSRATLPRPRRSALIFPPSLSLCVRQLSGMLPVKLHETTGGCTFLLNITLHSGGFLPPSPSLLLSISFLLSLSCSFFLWELWFPLDAFFLFVLWYREHAVCAKPH